jgi:hypothetical protein
MSLWRRTITCGHTDRSSLLSELSCSKMFWLVLFHWHSTYRLLSFLHITVTSVGNMKMTATSHHIAMCKLAKVDRRSEMLDDHVDGVRLRIWTLVTNGSFVYPQMIYEHGEPRWNIYRGNSDSSVRSFSNNSTSSHLVAKQDMTKEMNFAYEIYLSCS